MDDKRHVNARGSFTIEAAVVMPITMMIVLAVIMVTFYVHDLVTVTAVCDFAALERAGKFDNNSSSTVTDVGGVLTGRLIHSSGGGVSISEDDSNIYVSASGSFNLPIPFINELTGNSLNGVSAAINLTNLNGRKKLLIYKSICDGVSFLVGGWSKENGS